VHAGLGRQVGGGVCDRLDTGFSWRDRHRVAGLRLRYAPICAARFRVDRERWTGPKAVWDAFTATHESYPYLPANWQSQSRPTSARHRKIESTVRYLGIEVDDALAIAEQKIPGQS
jgi:hypothetical protein